MLFFYYILTNSYTYIYYNYINEKINNFYCLLTNLFFICISYLNKYTKKDEII